MLDEFCVLSYQCYLVSIAVTYGGGFPALTAIVIQVSPCSWKVCYTQFLNSSSLFFEVVKKHATGVAQKK